MTKTRSIRLSALGFGEAPFGESVVPPDSACNFKNIVNGTEDVVNLSRFFLRFSGLQLELVLPGDGIWQNEKIFCAALVK